MAHAVLDEPTPVFTKLFTTEHFVYICSEPCPADASQCEVLDLDPANHPLARSKQTFQPGTMVHLGAPAAPFADHFAAMLRLTPE